MRGLSWRNFDFLLLGAVVLASAFGAMMIRSAVAGNEGLLPLGNRQIYFAIAGVAVIILLASHRLSLLAFHPLADLHRDDDIPGGAFRVRPGCLRRTTLVPGRSVIRPTH